MKARWNAKAVGTVVARRRLLTGMAALPLMALAAALGVPVRAHAATGTIPSAVRDLDAAAMALFDAAEASRWPIARQALERTRTAADAMGGLESAYVAAGGRLTQLFQARNDLTGDLVEANSALAVKDSRWLVSSAGRIATRAGELSEPFAEHDNVLIPRIEALLHLTRRMRRALVWKDNDGYRAARDDFDRLWGSLRVELDAQPKFRVRALDDALTRVSASRSSANLKLLYSAILPLLDPVR